MIKHVFELYSEIYKGNIDKLPEKIIVGGIKFYKNKYYKDYYTKLISSEETRLINILGERLDADTEDILQLPVVEEKEEKWKPKKGEYYWYVDLNGNVDDYSWNYDNADNFLYNTGNCFKTKEEAQKHLDNINTEIELRELAEELNDGEEINWHNANQGKNYFYYDYYDDCIYSDKESTEKNAKTIYCLDYNFREKAIEKIGEERLKNYLKEE